MKLAVLDLDGTLTNTSAVDEACFVLAFADAFGITKLDTDWSRYEDATDEGIARAILEKQFGRMPRPGELAKLAACFFHRLKERCAPATTSFDEVPGAGSLLRRLRNDSGWGVAIATGSWERSARFKIRAAGLPIDGIPMSFAEDGPSRESIVRTAVMRAAAHHRRRGFDRIVSVGDAIWDVRTAKRLKLPFVGVGDGERAETLRSAGADRVIADFLDRRLCLSCLEEATIPQEDPPPRGTGSIG